jgi:hypothetical protein
MEHENVKFADELEKASGIRDVLLLVLTCYLETEGSIPEREEEFGFSLRDRMHHKTCKGK